jgi:hypothetical protein
MSSQSDNLLAPVGQSGQRLLGDLYGVFVTRGHWPTWGWFIVELGRRGDDPSDEVDALPRWPPHAIGEGYGLVWTSTLGGQRDPKLPIGLTVAGLAQLESAAGLVASFLSVVRYASRKWQALSIEPEDVPEIVIYPADLTAAGVRTEDHTAIVEVLEREPATWGSHQGTGPEWTWRPGHHLARFGELSSVADYLTHLRRLILPGGQVQAEAVDAAIAATDPHAELLHIQLSEGLTKSARVFDMTEEDLEALLERRARDEPIWLDGKEFDWRRAETRIIRARRVAGRLDRLAAWLNLLTDGIEVTNTYITGPPGMALLQTPVAVRAPSDPRRVAVVHGRDDESRTAVFDYLRALDLRPLEWDELVAATGRAAPFVGDVIDQLFAEAQAVVVVLTPDDVVYLHPDLAAQKGESLPAGQARPNVLLEAGIALGRHPDRTVFIEIGDLRPVSDLAGRHTIRPTTPQALHSIARRLATAGCPVDTSGSDWMSTDRFAGLAARSRLPPR